MSQFLAALALARVSWVEGLGGDDKQGGFSIQVLQDGDHVGRIDVGDELRGDAGGGVGTQGLGCHGRTQVGSADTDVDDLLDGPPGVTEPRTGAQRRGEVTHTPQDLVDIGGDILTVDLEVFLDREAKRGVEDGAVLGVVDVLAAEHGLDAVLEAGLLGE